MCAAFYCMCTLTAHAYSETGTRDHLLLGNLLSWTTSKSPHLKWILFCFPFIRSLPLFSNRFLSALKGCLRQVFTVQKLKCFTLGLWSKGLLTYCLNKSFMKLSQITCFHIYFVEYHTCNECSLSLVSKCKYQVIKENKAISGFIINQS